MKRTKAEYLEFLRNRYRVVAVLGLPAEVALEQSDAAAILEVDCGNDLHHCSSRKFCKIRAPEAAERSG